MKSIGIITYHHHYNYGTMLQAYALQKYISLMGYDAELINFKIVKHLSFLDMLKLRLSRLPVYMVQHKKYISIALAKKELKERELLFESFYGKNIIVGNEEYTSSKGLEENPPIYDGYIVGSDQTWNPYASGGPDAFLLPFVKDNKRKGSYAPSISVISLTDEQEVRLKRNLENIKFLSCREIQGANLLRRLMGRDVQCVIDPTMLLDFEEWNKVATPFIKEEPYILTYFLGDVKEHRVFVDELAKKTGFKVFSIPCSYLELGNKKWDSKWCGPDQFISLIKNADYVCTDSFHGTAFSINFNIPFFSFCKNIDNEITSENSRLYSLLEIFGLSNRLICNTELPPDLIIDFSDCNSILAKKREEASLYLTKMLKTITR